MVRIKKTPIAGLTHGQIKEFYDQNPNLTLRELSIFTGYSVPQLKKILMGT